MPYMFDKKIYIALNKNNNRCIPLSFYIFYKLITTKLNIIECMV